MRNFWLVAHQEYGKRVRKRTFLISTLGVPLLIIGILGLSILAVGRGNRDAPIGYVDHSGILAAGVLPTEPGEEDDEIEVRAYTDEEAARSALERDEIQGYYVLASGFRSTGELDLYYMESRPSESARDSFEAYVRANAVSELPAESRARLTDGSDVTIRSDDGGREFGRESILNFLLPFVVGFIFVTSVISSAGYLLQVVADEKENRTMEIMITSVSPLSLIAGKAMALVAVSFTQMAIWSVVGLVALAVGARNLETIEPIRLSIPWSFLLVSALFFVPSFALIAGIMTAIGSAVSDVRQGQQIAGLLNLLFMFPYFVMALLFTNPNSPLFVVLTLFPTTALLTVTLRWSVTIIPMWQLVVSWILLSATALLSVLLSARIFRAGMLNYGQPLGPRAVLTAIRAR